MSTMTIQALPGAMAQSRPAKGGELRLTRRGRVVLFLAGLVLITVAFASFGSLSNASDEPLSYGATQTVTIHAGDTLWDLARGVTGGADVDAMVNEIMDMNNLTSALVRPGQKLRIPRT